MEKIKLLILEKLYIHNNFTKFSQQILRGKLLLTITSEWKNNFSGKFILKLVITYHLKFIVKVLKNIVIIAILLIFFFFTAFLYFL